MRALRQALDDAPGLVLAVVFGSAAHDKSRPQSDLDVGVRFVEELDSNSTARLTEATLDCFTIVPGQTKLLDSGQAKARGPS